MKMLKIAGTVTVIFLIIFVFTASVGAVSYSDEVRDIYNILDSETQELLKDIGADKADFDSMFSVTPQKVWSLTKKLVT